MIAYEIVGSRAYKMVTIIIVAYIVAWAPYFIVQIVRLALNDCRSLAARIALAISAEFGALNAAVNFIIYALMNKDFKLVWLYLLSAPNYD